MRLKQSTIDAGFFGGLLAVVPLMLALGLAGNINAASLPSIIADAVASGESRIIIPPGQYRVTPQNREHLRLEGLRDVEIVAEGVEMICTQTTRAITIKDCADLTIRGLTIDYDPLPFTQGRIVATDSDTLTFEIIAGYPTQGIPHGGKVEVFNGQTDALRSHTYYGATTEPQGDGRFLVTKPRQFRGDQGEFQPQIGDTVVVNANHAPGGLIPHAVFVEDSEGLTFEDVTLYAANMFGFLEIRTSGSVYRRCVVDRRPLAKDLKPRDHRRVRSLNADAFHSKSARIGPQYLDCVAKHQGDDSFAINGHYHLVTESAGSTLRVLGKRDGTIELAVGEPVELVRYTGERLPEAVVTAIVPDGSINDTEMSFLQEQRMHAGLKQRNGMLNDAYRVTLDRPIDLPIGSVITSRHQMGNGFVIEGCELGNNRSRGILVKCSGIVRNNTITGTWGEAIKVAPEWWWLEAGHATDVRIEGNDIRDTRGIPIAVHSLSGTGEIAPAGAHRDVRITENRMADTPPPAIFVTSATGLTIEGNAIASHAARRLFPWVANRYRLGHDPDDITLVQTEDH
ncbi:MAG: right-handed parallel beta-helix repeat-containing protein [Planctomycetota bacterium]